MYCNSNINGGYSSGMFIKMCNLIKRLGPQNAWNPSLWGIITEQLAQKEILFYWASLSLSLWQHFGIRALRCGAGAKENTNLNFWYMAYKIRYQSRCWGWASFKRNGLETYIPFIFNAPHPQLLNISIIFMSTFSL